MSIAQTRGTCGRGALAALLLTLVLPTPVRAVAPQAVQSPAIGRVVVTVTTLEGGVHLPGAQVELRRGTTELVVVARSLTDGGGEVIFPDIAPGEYVVGVSRAGFVARDSTPFMVGAGETTRVLLDTQLTFVLPEVQVRTDVPAATGSLQPVSISDMLSGAVFESAPLLGDDFQSLLPLLPSVVRDSNGRLRIRGGQPSQSALQISSASLIDPVSGEFDLDLPGSSIQSVEVLANPFAAEYGRFSTSITQIRTRRGTNDWQLSPGNLLPRFRGLLRSVRAFEPRLSVRGPIRTDRVFVAQDLQFRYVATPVKSLPGEPVVDLRSFDSFTRVDSVVSSRHTVGGSLILFPREVRHVTMDTFRPRDTTPDFNQRGWSAGGLDRFALSPGVVLETTVSLRRFEIEVGTTNTIPMVYAPDGQSGGFFNDQERDVTSVQVVESLSLSRHLSGDHVLKFGSDLQFSRYDGTSTSRPVEIRRLDGTLAERIEFAGPSQQRVSATEIAAFVQDRWRLSSGVSFELGLRFDRDPVVDRINWSPRAGLAVGVLPEGRAIVRGGFGTFIQRTPLNVGAFTSFEPRSVSRFAASGATLSPAVQLVHTVDGELQTPAARVASVEWDQRFGRRLLWKAALLHRTGRHEYILSPDPIEGRLRLSSTGASRYREMEHTIRYLGGERRDLTLSYVWARGTADLNNYDQFYGNLRNPLVRANAHNLISTDVPHRVLLRGTVGLPAQWDVAPVLELRSGFPWSAVDEFQEFVGPRSRAGRLAPVRTLDLSVARPWRLGRYRFRAGIRVYNVFNAPGYRDIQSNVTAPSYGQGANPLERSVGFLLQSL